MTSVAGGCVGRPAAMSRIAASAAVRQTSILSKIPGRKSASMAIAPLGRPCCGPTAASPHGVAVGGGCASLCTAGRCGIAAPRSSAADAAARLRSDACRGREARAPSTRARTAAERRGPAATPSRTETSGRAEGAPPPVPSMRPGVATVCDPADSMGRSSSSRSSMSLPPPEGGGASVATARRSLPRARRHADPAAARARHISDGYAPEASAREEPSPKRPSARSGCAMYRSHSAQRRAERC